MTCHFFLDKGSNEYFNSNDHTSQYVDNRATIAPCQIASMYPLPFYYIRSCNTHISAVNKLAECQEL